jgi:hypothetical protein
MLQTLINDFLFVMNFVLFVLPGRIVIEVWHVLVAGLLLYALISLINRLRIEY